MKWTTSTYAAFCINLIDLVYLNVFLSLISKGVSKILINVNDVQWRQKVPPHPVRLNYQKISSFVNMHDIAMKLGRHMY